MLRTSSLKRIILLLVMTFSLIRVNTNAQSCISGCIKDSINQSAVSGATISIKGLRGTTSDQNGNFTLCNLPADSFTITISHLAYQKTIVRAQLKAGENVLPDVFLRPATVDIDEVVITATRTDNRIIDAPGRVNMLTLKHIESIPVHTIDEVLQYTPGINYNRSFGIFSTKATVTMRGLSGKEQARVLVLLDGIPLNKSDGGTVDWNMIDISTVQKLEVIKGAGSALYGGNAMGGIINIVTRRPGEKLSVSASLEYGTYNTAGGRVNVGKSSKLNKQGLSYFWNTNLFLKKSDGYITQSQIDMLANPYIVKSNLREAGAMVKSGIEWKGNHRLEALFNYYNDNRGTGEKVYQPNGNATDHDSYGVTLNYSGQQREIAFRSSLYMLTENYKKVNEYLKDDYTWYNVLSVRRDMGWIGTASVKAWNLHHITSGLEMKHGSVNAYDEYYTSTDIVYNEGKILTASMFTQDEITFPGDKIKITAGLRYDIVRFYDGSFRIESPTSETWFMSGYQVPDMARQTWSALSPRISAQYKWKPYSRVYLQVSRGFRASALEDLCRSGRIKGGFKIANPALKPEYLTNFESGIDVLAFNKLNISASVYYSTGKDFQYYITNGESIDMGFGERPIMLRSNISKVKIYGSETELRYSFSDNLTVSTNYTFTHSVIGSYKKLTVTDTVDISGNYLTDVPAHMANIGITWKNKYLNSSLSAHYTGTQYINDQNSYDEIVGSNQYPAYLTIDLRLWKEFLSHYTASLNIQNLTDKKYYDSKYAVCPGRFITAEIQIKF